ncbi:MAG: hypothetical protein ACRECP_11055 [Methylocella sp.]
MPELARYHLDRQVFSPHELVVQFIVGAFMAVATWRLDGGAKPAPQHTGAKFQR